MAQIVSNIVRMRCMCSSKKEKEVGACWNENAKCVVSYAKLLADVEMTR